MRLPVLGESGITRLQLRPVWPEFVEMGARLDVMALVDNVEWWDRVPPAAEFDRSNFVLTFVHFGVLFDYELLETAIAQRADLDVRSYAFGSPLHIACDDNDRGTAELLLRSGAHADSVALLCLAA